MTEKQRQLRLDADQLNPPWRVGSGGDKGVAIFDGKGNKVAAILTGFRSRNPHNEAMADAEALCRIVNAAGELQR